MLDEKLWWKANGKVAFLPRSDARKTFNSFKFKQIFDFVMGDIFPK